MQNKQLLLNVSYVLLYNVCLLVKALETSEPVSTLWRSEECLPLPRTEPRSSARTARIVLLLALECSETKCLGTEALTGLIVPAPDDR
jgi:hypothetical protein